METGDIGRVSFKHCTILHPETGLLESGRSIEVRDGRIAAITEDAAAPADAIDVGGLTVMPGMIDCHVHAIASDMNLGRNAMVPNILISFRAIPILEGMLQRGFTTVRDAGGADFSLAQATATGLVAGPRIFPSGRALSQTGGHGDFRARNDVIEPCACSHRLGAIARVVDGVDNVRLAVREEIQKGATQIKVMASGGVASPNDPIHFLGYSEAELRAIVEEAANAGTYVMAHAYTPRAIERAVQCGVRTIEHGNLLDDASAAVMASHGAYLVPTNITYDALFRDGPRYGFPDELRPKIDDVREAGLRALAVAARAGVKIAFGSDLLGATHEQQARELALHADVLGNLSAIRSATTVAAEVLQQEGLLGTIRPGAHADLLFVDGNPLEDINVLLDQGARLRGIMKQGTWMKNTLRR